MDENMVMVPVPRHLVIDVYRFIASRVESKVEVMDGEQNGSAEEPSEQWRYNYSWSEDDLRHTLENGTRAIKLILLYLAKHADQEVPGKVLAKHVYGPDATGQNLGGALGSFTKTMEKLYGRRKWPFKPISPSDDKPYWKYVMYSDTAEKVLRLADELRLTAE